MLAEQCEDGGKEEDGKGVPSDEEHHCPYLSFQMPCQQHADADNGIDDEDATSLDRGKVLWNEYQQGKCQQGYRRWLEKFIERRVALLQDGTHKEIQPR